MKWLYWILHSFTGCPEKDIYKIGLNIEKCCKCDTRYVIGLRKSKH